MSDATNDSLNVVSTMLYLLLRLAASSVLIDQDRSDANGWIRDMTECYTETEGASV